MLKIFGFYNIGGYVGLKGEEMRLIYNYRVILKEVLVRFSFILIYVFENLIKNRVKINRIL